MANTNPNIPVNITPKGIDIVLDKINNSIDLSWLKKFGKAYVKDEAPVIKEQGRAEYYNLMPNDNLLVGAIKGVSFWQTEDNINTDEFEISNSHVFYNRDVSLILWVNLTKLYPTNPAYTSENVINEVLTALQKNNKFILDSITEGEKVFGKYKKVDNRFYELPYYCVSFNGNISYQYKLDC